jgi:hypothetical protein
LGTHHEDLVLSLSKDEARTSLSRALVQLPGFADIGPADIEPMLVGGIAHDHFRIVGRGAVLRVPRLSQFGLAPVDNLAYQAAGFARAHASGRTPRLIAVLPAAPDLPYGALVVEEIVGRRVRLPDDLEPIAEALARLHELPLPPAPARAPLRDHRDPVAATLAVILAQAEHLHDARLHPDALGAIAEELGWARQFAGEIAGGMVKAAQPIALVATDTHPGNFLIAESGRAVLVDLEKMLYGAPAIDLAHATLYTSTTWEREVAAVLSVEQTARFYRAYLDQRPAEIAVALKPWLLPMRRITWLRTITWMIRWRAVSAARADDPALGPWSRSRLAPDLVAHMLARIDDFTDPATIARIRVEWLEHSPLERLL